MNILIRILITILFTTLSAASVLFAEEDRHQPVATDAASYVTQKSLCSDCHYEGSDIDLNSVNNRIRKSWAASGHADVYSFAWSSHDYKLFNGCVRCHTTTGFIAYSSGQVFSAWGNATEDKTRELLTCKGCHTDITSGVLRSPVTIQPYANDSYRNQDVGPSNLCAGCHSGTVSGRSIKALTNFSTSFVSSHYFAASGILFKSSGYEYSGKEYSNNAHFKHDRIGISNYTVYGYSSGNQGPCIACHMSSTDKHSYSPVTKDSFGVVTAVTSSICVGCHTDPANLDAARMNSRKERFSSSLLALQMVLESRGIKYFAGRPPYFYNSSNSAYTAWRTADFMGAAFNLHLLSHEPGAYAHNMVYATRLIYDSIDYMDDGVLNGSVVAAINALTTMAPAQRLTAIGYLTKAGARP